MPLPVAHTGVAIACYLCLPKNQVQQLEIRKKAFLLFILAFLASLPDLDFLPGIMAGQPNKYHHGPSHSIIVAFIAALAVYAMTSRYFHELGKRIYLLALCIASVSHTLLDYFSKDTGHPFGVPLLWPLEKTYYISATSLFSDVERSSDPGMAFVLSLFNSHNLIGIAGEILFVVMILSAVAAIRHRRLLRHIYYWSTLSVLSAVGLVIFTQYLL